MKTYFIGKKVRGIVMSLSAVAVLLPCTVLADPSSSPACNALVSFSNNLYLVNPASQVLTQFTFDSVPKTGVALSPDGGKVAYVADNPNAPMTEFEVVNTNHQQATYSIFQLQKDDDPAGFITGSAFQELLWNSDQILSVETVGGKNGVFWLFRRIPYNLGSRAPLVIKPPMADSCTLSPRGDRLACLDSGGAVYLNGGSVRGRMVFSVTGFEGIKPEESFTLGVGESVNTHGTTPSYAVTLVSVGKNGITLEVTPPSGVWEKSTIQNGGGLSSPPPYDSGIYAFNVTIVNPITHLVRVDVVKSDSPDELFDPALTWLPDGRGLLLIRRTDTEAFLYVIGPGHRAQQWGDRDGRHDQWAVIAQAPISVPEQIDSIRFATPSLLLLKDDLGNFSKTPIKISHDHGVETLTLGTVMALPSALAVQLNGIATQGSVLDWSCEAPRGAGKGGR